MVAKFHMALALSRQTQSRCFCDQIQLERTKVVLRMNIEVG